MGGPVKFLFPFPAGGAKGGGLEDVAYPQYAWSLDTVFRQTLIIMSCEKVTFGLHINIYLKFDHLWLIQFYCSVGNVFTITIQIDHLPSRAYNCFDFQYRKTSFTRTNQDAHQTALIAIVQAQ